MVRKETRIRGFWSTKATRAPEQIHVVANDAMNNNAEDDDMYRASIRSMFVGDVDDDDSDDDAHISQHVWSINQNSSNPLSIIYHLALLAPGHGNSLWNACICIAEQLSSASNRSELFGPAVYEKMTWPPKSSLEFGAGAALPSLVLLKEGAERVIITDRKVNEQTFEALELSVLKNSQQWNINDSNERVKIEAHTWGEDIDKLIEGKEEEGVDILIASDCIYNPAYHEALLQSAAGTISNKRGLFILGYSYHTNVKAQQVEAFFTSSENYGFEVISEFKQEYKEQMGIGSKDPDRAVVYCKVLANRDSIYCQ